MTKTNYPLGDGLIRIKNAAAAYKKEVKLPFTKSIYAVCRIMKKAGYLSEVKKEKDIISLRLVYRQKKPILMDLKLVSKPGLRVYMGVGEIESKKGPSKLIISTPRGIMLTKDALKVRMGGEVIAEVW